MKKTLCIILLLHLVSADYVKATSSIKTLTPHPLNFIQSTNTHNDKIDSINEFKSKLFNQKRTEAFYASKIATIEQLISTNKTDTAHLQLIWNDIDNIGRDNDSLSIKALTYIVKNTTPFVTDSTINKNKLSFYRELNANSLTELGSLQSYGYNFQPAIENLYAALELQKKYGDARSQAYILAELADLYSNMGNAEKNYLYNKEVLGISELKKSFSHGYALTNIANLLIEKEDSLLYAISLCRKSEAIFRSFTDDYWPQSIASNYVAIGDAYFLLNNEDSAFFYHQKAVRMFIEDTQFSNDVWSYAYKIEANLYFKSKKYKKAIETSTKGIKHGLAGSYLSGIKNNYNIRSKSFKALGNYKKALADYTMFVLYQDSIEQLDKTKMAFRYDLEHKYKTQKLIDEKNYQKEIFIVNQKAQIVSDKQERKILLIYIVLFIVILIAIFIGVSFRQNKKIANSLKEKNQLIKESLEQKEMFMKEIHHRVKNNMQMASSILQLKSAATNNSEVKKELLDSQSRIFSMSLAHKMMYEHDNFELLKISEYIKEIIEAAFNNYENNQLDELSFTSDDILINVEQAQAVGYIIHELALNSIKHAWNKDSNKTLTINIQKQNNNIKLTYKDNGKGLPDDFNIETVSSMGLKLVRSFTKRQLKGNIIFLSDNGTTIIISFKPRT